MRKAWESDVYYITSHISIKSDIWDVRSGAVSGCVDVARWQASVQASEQGRWFI